MNAAIDVKNVNFSYNNNINVLENISFCVNPGERLGIIGANGTGKSTLLKIIMGLLPFEGDIAVAGLDLNRKNLNLIRKKAGLVIQDSDNQLFMPTLHEDMMFGPRNYGLNEPDAEKAVDRALNDMGIAELKNRQTYRMSGGEKRMAAIATILAMNPEIILLDEPSIALDPCNRRRLIKILNTMPQTLIIASHDLDMILETCDRVIIINNHQIVADGRSVNILENEKLLYDCRLELPLCMQTSIPYNREDD